MVLLLHGSYEIFVQTWMTAWYKHMPWSNQVAWITSCARMVFLSTTICPGSRVTHYIKWVSTSWTHSKRSHVIPRLDVSTTIPNPNHTSHKQHSFQKKFMKKSLILCLTEANNKILSKKLKQWDIFFFSGIYKIFSLHPRIIVMFVVFMVNI